MISVNEEVVHTVPGSRRISPGDLVKIDVTAEQGGFFADAAATVIVPPASPTARRLASCVHAAFAEGMRAACAGGALNEIGRKVEAEIRRRGFTVLRELRGHGIGRTIHEPPEVANYYDPLERGPRLRPLDPPHPGRQPGRPPRAHPGDHPRPSDPGDGGVAERIFFIC
jgi:methionyl aminopeptidase